VIISVILNTYYLIAWWNGCPALKAHSRVSGGPPHRRSAHYWINVYFYCNLYLDTYLYMCRLICLKYGWKLSRSRHKQYSRWSCHGSVVECFRQSFWHWFTQSCCMYTSWMLLLNHAVCTPAGCYFSIMLCVHQLDVTSQSCCVYTSWMLLLSCKTASVLVPVCDVTCDVFLSFLSGWLWTLRLLW